MYFCENAHTYTTSTMHLVLRKQIRFHALEFLPFLGTDIGYSLSFTNNIRLLDLIKNMILGHNFSKYT